MKRIILMHPSLVQQQSRKQLFSQARLRRLLPCTSFFPLSTTTCRSISLRPRAGAPSQVEAKKTLNQDLDNIAQLEKEKVFDKTAAAAQRKVTSTLPRVR